ncbi:MAG: DUF2927 domain-containing protein [Pseudomonadota bacterium]
MRRADLAPRPILRRAAVAAASLSLAACAAPPPPSVFHEPGRVAPQRIVERPDYPGYGAAIAKQDIPWDVDSLVEDFVELNLTGEWDREFDRLLRWEDPVRVALVGPELEAYRGDVEALVGLIDDAAPGLDIAVAQPGGRGQITIRTAPRAEMKAVDESALCFITPYGLDWRAYVDERAGGEDEWAGLQSFEAMTIFIPAYSAPQVFRACFVEEIMQALGPSNDLYRLEDSGFNDDEVHLAPTAFDLLMLRVLYDDALEIDMTPTETRAAARRALRRIVDDRGPRRPRYRSRYDKEFQTTHFFADIADEVEMRRELIGISLAFAEDFAEDDHRRGEALRSAAYFELAHGTLNAAIGYAREAVAQFAETLPADSARLARTRADLAYFLLLDRKFAAAIALLDEAEPVLAAHAKEADLASALRLKAIALVGAGRSPEAREAARDAVAWAAYVFGADSRAVRDWRALFAEFELSV